MNRHKHAELIKAWADGAEIQVYYEDTNDWKDCSNDRRGFNWYENLEYRIKPEPKPDNVMFCKSTPWGVHSESNIRNSDHNLKQVFDGETGKLKDAEVLK